MPSSPRVKVDSYRLAKDFPGDESIRVSHETPIRCNTSRPVEDSNIKWPTHFGRHPGRTRDPLQHCPCSNPCCRYPRTALGSLAQHVLDYACRWMVGEPN